MRFTGVIGSFAFMAILFSSCQKSTNTNPVPVISFKSFQSTSMTSGILQVNFTDGDGDIGYATQSTSNQPNFWVKYLYYDYTSKQYIGVRNTADSATFDSVYFVYNVPYITPSGKDKSLTGIIQIAMNTWYANPYSTTDSLKVQFKIWLLDRAGNKSNVITTPTLYPGQSTP